MKQLLSPLLCIWLCAAGTALPGASLAQDAKQTRNTESTNILGDFGRWIDQSLTSIGDQFRSAGKKLDNLNREAEVAAKSTADVAADAADAVARIPKTRMVRGHQTCPPAENGAPDCVVAANKLCQAKGMKSGTSLGITSARDCPTRALVEAEAKAQCRDVTFVTSAMCQ